MLPIAVVHSTAEQQNRKMLRFTFFEHRTFTAEHYILYWSTEDRSSEIRILLHVTLAASLISCDEIISCGRKSIADVALRSSTDWTWFTNTRMMKQKVLACIFVITGFGLHLHASTLLRVLCKHWFLAFYECNRSRQRRERRAVLHVTKVGTFSLTKSFQRATTHHPIHLQATWSNGSISHPLLFEVLLCSSVCEMLTQYTRAETSINDRAEMCWHFLPQRQNFIPFDKTRALMSRPLERPSVEHHHLGCEDRYKFVGYIFSKARLAAAPVR